MKFWLFPKVKITTKGKHSGYIQDEDAAVMVPLNTQKEDFQNGFRKWQEWWDKCVQSEREDLEREMCLLLQSTFKKLNIHHNFNHIAYKCIKQFY